jgi:hypothetical protein
LTESGFVERFAIENCHTGGVKAVAVDFCGGIGRICSFSYDQAAVLTAIDFARGEKLESTVIPLAISDGEAVEFVEGGIVAFGAGIQFHAL